MGIGEECAPQLTRWSRVWAGSVWAGAYDFSCVVWIGFWAKNEKPNMHSKPTSPHAIPSKDMSRIILFGDSITEQSFRAGGGWGAALADNYSRKLRRFFPTQTQYSSAATPTMASAVSEVVAMVEEAEVFGGNGDRGLVVAGRLESKMAAI
ncbi:hypothetical protein Droror1_Dr00008316 [Drosera rotundifolia]